MVEIPKTIATDIEHFTGRTWLLPTLLKWFEESNERMFILTGGPGTGKSMIMAWLAGYGPKPVDPEAATQLESIRQSVKATHFCMAASRNNSPQAFAENVANQITSNVRGFGDALAATLEERLQITSVQHVQTVAEGGNVTGISIGRIDLGTLGDEESFDRAFTKPLKKLYSDGYKEPFLLLIDALDESQTYTGNISLIKILTSLNDLPQHVRILATTRPDPRVLKYFQGVAKFDLIENAPNNVNDVREYVTEQLTNFQTIGVDRRAIFSDHLSEAAQGIFLYAYMVLNDLKSRFPNVPDPERYPLPIGLSGFYHEFLNRELGKDEDRWYETFKPLLGFIAVSYSEGLTRTQLQKMVGKDIEQALRVCKQYLAGDFPEGPFRPFHRSFVDFLLEDEKNIDYHIDSMIIHSQIVDYYRNKAPSWEKVDWKQLDDYGLLHLAYHMKKAGKEEELRKLLLNYEWMSAKLKNVYITQENGEKKPDVNSLLKDYDYLPGDKEIELVQGAIRLSTSALIKDKTQLAGQLLGRLESFPEIEIRLLLRAIREHRNGTRILPITDSLMPPGGPLLYTLEGLSIDVTDFFVTPNGNYGVSASNDNTLKVWDLKTGNEVHTLRGHRDRVRAVSVTPDGNWAVSVSDDKTLKIWDLKTGNDVHALVSYSSEVKKFSAILDGNYAVSASDDNTLKVWDLKTGNEVHTLRGLSNVVWAISITPNGNYVVSASSDKKLKVWDFKTGNEVYTLRGHSKYDYVTPDGNYAVSSSYDADTSVYISRFSGYLALKVWNLKTGNEVHTLKGHSDVVWAISITPNGNYAVSASSDKTLKVWDLKTGNEIHTLKGHFSSVIGVSVTPNGDYAVSGSVDGTFIVWDLKTGYEVLQVGYRERIEAFSVFHDGNYAVSGSMDGTLIVWDLKTGNKVHTLEGHRDRVRAVSVTADGNYAVSASNDRTLKVWDLKTGSEVHTLKGHRDRVRAVSVIADRYYAVSASSDKTLKVWDLKTGNEVHTLEGHSYWVTAVSVTSDGNYAVSISDDNTLKIWDLKNGNIVRTLTGHSDFINAVSVTPDGNYVVSASTDKTLKIWDFETGTEISSFRGESPFFSVVFSPDGTTIVAGEASGRIHFLLFERGSEDCK